MKYGAHPGNLLDNVLIFMLWDVMWQLPVSLVQVLSHNLYTVLNIPHDPVALEEHFQDDDDGPVSNHGYMPYLNKYILDKVPLKSLSQ